MDIEHKIRSIEKKVEILSDLKEYLKSLYKQYENVTALKTNLMQDIFKGLKIYNENYRILQKEIEDLKNEEGGDKQTLEEIRKKIKDLKFEPYSQKKIKDLKLEHYSEEDVEIAYA